MSVSQFIILLLSPQESLSGLSPKPLTALKMMLYREHSDLSLLAGE